MSDNDAGQRLLKLTNDPVYMVEVAERAAERQRQASIK